jgi:hypothetical protein
MSKKHYRALARIIYQGTQDYSELGAFPFGQLVQNLSDYLKRDNPLFDPERFRRACETGEGAARIDQI